MATRVRTQATDAILRLRPDGLTANQSTVWDVADAIGRVPPVVDATYGRAVERAAAFLGAAPPQPVKNIDPSNPRASFVSPSAPLVKNIDPSNVRASFVSATPVTQDLGTGLEFVNAVMAARNAVIDVMNRVNSFISRAKNAGFGPPVNPFVRISELNAARVDDNVDVSAQDADDLTKSIVGYLELLKGEQTGAIDLDHNVVSSAQLSSVSLSFEGYGTSGNSAADLMKFLPDLDAIKRQKATDALAVLDFKRRVPRMVFTANYSPDRTLRGSVVGWRRIPDASGYVIKRRSLFTGEQVSFTLTNDQLQTSLSAVRDYVDTWVMGFYKFISTDSVYVYVDGSVSTDQYYLYTVQAYQVMNDAQGTIFSVDANPFNMSMSQRLELKSKVASLDPSTGGASVSPWPAIAQQLLGKADYDWILAGVNVRGSVKRSDTRTDTRGYSYLSSQLDFLFARMDAGKFLFPADINSVVKNVKSAINRFGVTQALQEVMQDTGVLYHFDGKEAQDDTHFTRVGALDPSESSLMSSIASSIDPETATLDLRGFTSNFPQVIAGRPSFNASLKTGGNTPFVQASSTEVQFPSGPSSSDVQFIDELGQVDDAHVDLTSFEGISKLIRTVRIMSDVGGNRGNPLVDPSARTDLVGHRTIKFTE